MSKSTKLYHLQLLQLQQIGKKVIRDHGNWLQLNLQFPRLPIGSKLPEIRCYSWKRRNRSVMLG